MTQLPDGRVLKGSRKEQRDAAAFWTDVEQEAQVLIPPAEQEHIQDEVVEHVPATPERTATGKKAARSPRVAKTPKPVKAAARRTASAKAESRVNKPSTKKKGVKPAGSVTRPSQRGYKWPKPEEA